MIELHYPAKGDLPEPSGEMRAQRKKVLAYTKSLGWTQAVRMRRGKNKFEWVCSDYDGNTRFFDDEITAWTELPEPEQEGKINGLCLFASLDRETGRTESTCRS